jgi:hypothetical protein
MCHKVIRKSTLKHVIQNKIKLSTTCKREKIKELFSPQKLFESLSKTTLPEN